MKSVYYSLRLALGHILRDNTGYFLLQIIEGAAHLLIIVYLISDHLYIAIKISYK